MVTEKEILADPLPPLEYTSSRKSTRGRAHVRPEAVIVGDLSGLSAAAIALQEGADNRELVYQRLPKKFEVQMESEGGIGGIIQQAILPPLNQRAKRATETGFSWVQLPSLVDWRPDGAGGSAPLAGLAGAAGGPAGVPAAATGREEKREAEGPSTEACPQALQEPPGTDASGAAALTEMDRKGKGKVDESEGKRALDPPEVIESAETDKRRLRKRDQEGKVSIESKSNPMVPPLDSKQALKKKKTDFLLRKLKKVENPETLNLDELQELEEVEEVGDAPSEERDSSALMPEEGGGPVASGRGPLGEHGGEGSAEGAEGAGPSTSEVKPSNAAPKAPKITYFYRDGRLVMELKYRGVPKKLADAFNRGDPAAIDLVGQGYGYAAYLDLDFFVITDYEVWFVCRIINGFPELVEIAGPFLRTDVRPTVMALLFVVQDRVLEEREERPSWREQLQGKHILREHFEALEQRLEQEKEDAEAAALGQETESE